MTSGMTSPVDAAAVAAQTISRAGGCCSAGSAEGASAAGWLPKRKDQLRILRQNTARILILTTFDLDEYVYEACQRLRNQKTILPNSSLTRCVSLQMERRYSHPPSLSA
jgi:hypothetical protein